MKFYTPINLSESEYKFLENETLELPEEVTFRISYPLKNAFNVIIKRDVWDLHSVLFTFDMIYRTIYQEEVKTDTTTSVLEIACFNCKSNILNFYESSFQFERFDTTSCRICISDRMSSKILLPCGHKFHFSCLKKWFKKSNKCPLCNQPIRFCETCNSKRIIEVFLDVNEMRRIEGLERMPTNGKFGIGSIYYEEILFSGIKIIENIIELEHLLF